MHDRHGWENGSPGEDWSDLGRTVGPLPPEEVIDHWGGLLAQGARRERLSAYAVTAGGLTVSLPGPHLGGLPRGLLVSEGRVSLSGLDERGQRVWLGGLHARPAKVYLFVPDSREEDRGPGANGSA